MVSRALVGPRRELPFCRRRSLTADTLGGRSAYRLVLVPIGSPGDDATEPRWSRLLSRRRVNRRTWWILGSASVVVAALWLDRSLVPLFDDGPFVGKECTSIPSRSPDQIFAVLPGYLELFDATELEPAPIVLRRRADGHVAWCVIATGGDHDSVRRIRFSTVRVSVFGPVVDGLVEWTSGADGAEHTRWIFWWTGGLRAYWFSW